MDSDGVTRGPVVRAILAVVALAALALLVLAIRAVFVGSPTFEPVLFAELYIWAFGIWVFVWRILVPTLRRTRGEYAGLMLVSALAGALIFHPLAPTIGEPNYCGDLSDYPNNIDLRMPPQTFRCTTAPFDVAGWLVGWGLMLWVVTKRHR